MKVQSLQDHAQHSVSMDGASGVQMRMLVGPEDGARNFHMRHFEVARGGHTPHHRHDYEHEVLVLQGRGFVKSARGDRPIGPRDVVWVPANEMHQFVNAGEEPLEFICLIPAPEDCAR